MASNNYPNQGAWLNTIARQIKRFQDFQAGLNCKPYWASHLSNRTWRRHSALLTCRHEMTRNQ